MARRLRELTTQAVTKAGAISLLAVCISGIEALGHQSPKPSPSPSVCAVATPTPTATPKPTPSATATPSPSVSPTAPPPAPKPTKSDDWTQTRHAFEQLSPDQQKKFIDNLSQWKAMTPEEQELFRDRELFRNARIAQEIQTAINRSGLHLDDDEREVYALRYTQERRKIEEALRKEMDQKRASMVNDMLGKLKQEFGPLSAAPPPPPKATPTPTPGK
jgi:hypothetical protein